MDNLDKRVILYLGRTPDFETEVILQDDGSGPYIKEWNITSEKAKPTDSQLNALASDAVKLNNNEIVKATRKKSYGDIGEQLDEIYKDIDAWKARIKSIKDANPKEE
jgi:hypothetical protein